MNLPAIDNLVSLLSTLPGIGSRSARRIVFHLIKEEPQLAKNLGRLLGELRERVQFCNQCGGISESELCPICRDPDRDQEILCLVEDPGDVFAVESTGEYHGHYHVLMGALSPLDGIGPQDLRIGELQSRIAAQPVKEILIATNPTMEGDATASYITALFRNLPIRMTRISHGITTGATLEYADSTTLARSIKNRQEI